MKVGLTLGKFAPLHKGHQYLIETALAQVDQLVILIYECDELPCVSLDTRAQWLRDLYPQAEIIVGYNSPQATGYTAEIMRLQENYILQMLNGRHITHFFSSEAYGEHVSQALGAIDVRVDMARATVPISATQLRNNAALAQQYLAPRVYRDLVQTIKPVIDCAADAHKGMKRSHFGKQQLEFVPGKVMIGFYPTPVETEVIQATEEAPFLLVGLALNHRKMATILSRLDEIEATTPPPVSAADPTNLFSIPLNTNLLEPFIRLVELLDNPTDAAILSNNIIDEIYYRILSQERGGELRALLQQQGDIQRIAKVINYIHQHLNQSISVDQLAEMVMMSRTAFFKHFKAVMHMSPLQYAKKIKLNEAQRLIKAGKRANEAGYLVGYGLPEQFSREYKQYFGYPPSATP